MSENKTILITGAAGTIGKATASIFAQKGYQPWLVDKDEQALKELSTTLGNCPYTALDVTSSAAVEAVFKACSGELSGVVLAAGIEGPLGNLEDIDEAAFKQVMDVNVTGVWLCMKQALKVLKPKNKGSIVVLSSISGTMANAGLSPYAASKHAVLGLVRSAARESASSGVRINAVCPGPVESSMMNRIDAEHLAQNPNKFGGKQNASSSIPMQRYATPEEIGEAIAYLCSDTSGYCTGTTLTLDGGFSCR